MHQRWFLLKSVLTAAICVAGLSAVRAQDEKADEKPAAKVDPTGTWTWDRPDQGGETVTTTLTIEMKDGKLSGTMKSPMGEIDFTDGELDGNVVAFEVVLERQGLEIPLYFEGKVEGDTIDGFIEIEFAGNVREMPWKPKRVAAAAGGGGGIAGTWLMYIETEDGQIFEPTMVIKKGDDGMTGNFVSQLGEAGVEDISVEGDTAKFTVKLDLGDGQALVSNYQGKLDGDKIEGTLEFDFAGQTGTATFSAKREADKVNLVGTWGLYIETEDGQIFEPTMVVKAADDGYTGTFNSQLGEAGIEDVEVDGDTVKFAVKLDFGDGQELISNYEGKIDGDKIEGKLEFDFAGQVGSADFKATRKAEEKDESADEGSEEKEEESKDE